MIRAKNYETAFKFVKSMPRIVLASFFPDTAYRTLVQDLGSVLVSMRMIYTIYDVLNGDWICVHLRRYHSSRSWLEAFEATSCSTNIKQD